MQSKTKYIIVDSRLDKILITVEAMTLKEAVIEIRKFAGGAELFISMQKRGWSIVHKVHGKIFQRYTLTGKPVEVSQDLSTKITEMERLSCLV